MPGQGTDEGRRLSHITPTARLRQAAAAGLLSASPAMLQHAAAAVAVPAVPLCARPPVDGVQVANCQQREHDQRQRPPAGRCTRTAQWREGWVRCSVGRPTCRCGHKCGSISISFMSTLALSLGGGQGRTCVPAEICERHCRGKPQVVHHHLLSLRSAGSSSGASRPGGRGAVVGRPVRTAAYLALSPQPLPLLSLLALCPAFPSAALPHRHKVPPHPPPTHLGLG